MRNEPTALSRLCLAVAILLLVPAVVSAQTATVPSRITAAIDEHNLTRLTGNTHPLARAEFDRGPAPDSLPMRRMLLVLKRGAAQEAALDQLMEEQQDASSSNFHSWLTPAQFGQQFGPSDQDIQTITSWLESHGFQIAKVSGGRTVIEFSGTAGQVQEAFHTAIHKYNVNGEDHWANASDPQIPTALTPVVAGVNTLYNFPREQMHRISGVYSRTRATSVAARAGTQFTFPDPCSPTTQPFCNFAVAPADFAKIYDVPNLLLTPAPTTQFNGDGVTIAIVAQSDIAVKDLTDFRTLFGLPAPKLNVILNGTDPGLDPGGAETEADLDVQWAGSIAPNATLDLVVSESTYASLGADLSAQYAVDNDLAPILNESFGLCEFDIGTSGNTFYSQVWQQAAAQGITVTVSAGDGGSAGCNRGQGSATLGLAVSGFTSTPYNISVGGTDFNDIGSFAEFWNTIPADTPTVPSALGYIPEMTWNNTCTNQEVFNFFGVTTAEQSCNNAEARGEGLLQVAGGSGGKSSCTASDGQNETSCSGGYTKPSWQTALTPADGKRDVPDVSLFASDGFNGSFYLICEADLVPGETSCDPNVAGSDSIEIGGTSASAPSFAGIMALVNQATGSRQGNANYILYKLAAQTGASCASAASPAKTCVFYDVPSGSTIAMPCMSGSLNCTVSNPGDSYGVLSGYATTSGYDLATGLGSVNAANLVAKWKASASALKPTTTTLTLNSGAAVNITHGQSVSVSIGVTGGGGTPSGNVSLVADTTPPGAPAGETQQGVQGFVLSSGSATGTTNALPGGGPYPVVAQYSGDGTFGASSSAPISVTVGKESSKTQLIYELFDPTTGLQTNPNATSAIFGTPSVLRIDVTSQAGDACAQNSPGSTGCPTGTIGLTDNAAALNGGTFNLNIQGYAEDPLIDLAGGVHNLEATYAGDQSYTAAAPGTETLTITPVATSTTMSYPGFSGLPGFITNQPEILNTSISAAQRVFTAIPPTGTVTYFSGTTSVGTVPIIGSVDATTHFAVASSTLTITNLPHGQDSLTAQYSGDSSYAPSASPAQVVSVLYPSMTVVTPNNPTIPHGTPVTLTATVTTTQSGAPAITGTVQFSSGPNVLGTSPVSAGQAQITTSTLVAGFDVVSATYSGDTNFAPSNGNGDVSVTLLPTMTVLTTSNASVLQGTSVTFTAAVSATGNPPSPPPLTGTVQFTYCFSDECGVMIGGPVAVTGGVAQVTTSSLQANTNQVTAAYSGDTNYAPSGEMISETVNPPPDFKMSSTYNSVNIPGPGNSGTMTLNVASIGGFSGTVSFTGCTGLPTESSCSFSPTSVTVSPNTLNGTTTVTIQTTAPSELTPGGHHGPVGISWRLAAVWAMVAFLFMGLLRALPRSRRWACAFLALAVLSACVSCGGGGGGNGGGGGGGGGGGNPSGGTPIGSYPNGVVTATSGSITHTFDFGVAVESQ
jgi:Pro-kumamolisin, activation domain/Bacterial Ig-like domain (group 3)